MVLVSGPPTTQTGVEQRRPQVGHDASSTRATSDLDRWIRGEFTELNTRLEELYFAEKAIILHGRVQFEGAPSEVADALQDAYLGGAVSS